MTRQSDHEGTQTAMTEQPTSAVMDVQRVHRSVRDYTEEPVDDALLARLIASAQGAASSSFIQAYSLVRVHRAEARARIAKAAGGQRWVEQAPVFLVCCADGGSSAAEPRGCCRLRRTGARAAAGAGGG